LASRFLFESYGDPRDLHSFPTRRSSDLATAVVLSFASCKSDSGLKVVVEKAEKRTIVETVPATGQIYPEVEVKISPDISGEVVRSEEHTSELQSRENLVCRLLLEKKNPA